MRYSKVVSAGLLLATFCTSIGSITGYCNQNLVPMMASAMFRHPFDYDTAVLEMVSMAESRYGGTWAAVIYPPGHGCFYFSSSAYLPNGQPNLCEITKYGYYIRLIQLTNSRSIHRKAGCSTCQNYHLRNIIIDAITNFPQNSEAGAVKMARDAQQRLSGQWAAVIYDPKIVHLIISSSVPKQTDSNICELTQHGCHYLLLRYAEDRTNQFTTTTVPSKQQLTLGTTTAATTVETLTTNILTTSTATTQSVDMCYNSNLTQIISSAVTKHSFDGQAATLEMVKVAEEKFGGNWAAVIYASGHRAFHFSTILNLPNGDPNLCRVTRYGRHIYLAKLTDKTTTDKGIRHAHCENHNLVNIINEAMFVFPKNLSEAAFKMAEDAEQSLSGDWAAIVYNPTYVHFAVSSSLTSGDQQMNTCELRENGQYFFLLKYSDNETVEFNRTVTETTPSGTTVENTNRMMDQLSIGDVITSANPSNEDFTNLQIKANHRGASKSDLQAVHASVNLIGAAGMCFAVVVTILLVVIIFFIVKQKRRSLLSASLNGSTITGITSSSVRNEDSVIEH